MLWLEVPAFGPEPGRVLQRATPERERRLRAAAATTPTVTATAVPTAVAASFHRRFRR